MFSIEFQTRDGSKPQGKPQALFSCHPADEKSCYELLSKDLFSLSDCVLIRVTRFDGTAEDVRELKELMENMRVIVIPLTYTYLTSTCRSMSIDVACAIERSVPILPIAMEDGLLTLFPAFEKVVGHDVQLIDRSASDNTTIPYREKLKRRLEDIFANDDLIQRIRSSFDAYIFLSYRKIDRSHANRLMRVIHSIPNCADYAIWYDEFLTPGESWSESIAEALRKSNGMIVLITPHAAEPKNYVAEHEYPLARQLRKPILPVVSEKTERSTLTPLFPGLPKLVDVNDTKAVERFLTRVATTGDGTFKSLLKSLAKDPVPANKSSSPEHDYLLGLAYLNAIDVERDPERATALITHAAEARLPEALEKLSNMYWYGDGVEVNLDRAIELRTDLLKLLDSQQFSQVGPWKVKTKLALGELFVNKGTAAEAIGSFSEAYTDAIMIQSAHALVDVELGLGHPVKDERGNITYMPDWNKIDPHIRQTREECTHDSAKVCEMLGNIYAAKGDLIKALEWLYNAITVYQGMITYKSRLPDVSVSIARVQLSRARCIESLSGGTEAIRFYKDALEKYRSLAQYGAKGSHVNTLITTYSRLGLLLQKEGDAQAAKNCITDTANLMQAMFANGTVRLNDEIARALLDFEELQLALRDFTRSENGLQILADYFASKVKATPTPTKLNLHAKALAMLGTRNKLAGERGRAEELYRAAVAQLSLSRNQEQTINTSCRLSETLLSLGDLLCDERHLDTAVEQYQSALSFAEEAARLLLASENEVELSTNTITLDFSKTLGKRYMTTRGNPKPQQLMIDSLARLARTQRALGHDDAAQRSDALRTIRFHTLLFAKPAATGSYEQGPITVTQEASFFVLASIQNMCRHPLIQTTGARLSMRITKLSECKTLVTSAFTCANAEPRTVESQILFRSEEPFTLVFINNSGYRYSEKDGFRSDKGVVLNNSIVAEEGAQVGFDKIDGRIPGGDKNKITVSIKLLVQR